MNKPTYAILLHRLTITLIILALGACSRPSTPMDSVHERIPIASGQTLTLNVDRGAIDLTSAAVVDLSLDVQAYSREPALLSIKRSGDGAQISFQSDVGWQVFPTRAAEISMRIPPRVAVKIDAFDGEIAIHDYRGVLQAAAVTGKIDARDFSGEITLISPRGDVHAHDGQGLLRVLGEHGRLAIENVNGKAGVSTIMGDIYFSGSPTGGDEIRLEADHGPIVVDLGKDSNLKILAQSNSGDVICLTPGITRDGRRCQGSLGSGEGMLWIRTVSGDITIMHKSE